MHTIYIKTRSTSEPTRWRSQLERSPRMRKVGCSNPSHDRPKSSKQVVIDSLLNAKQQVLEDDHFKRMPRAAWHSSCGTGKKTGNGDVSIFVKTSLVEGKILIEQRNNSLYFRRFTKPQAKIMVYILYRYFQIKQSFDTSSETLHISISYLHNVQCLQILTNQIQD